jgi:hypothetical protein
VIYEGDMERGSGKPLFFGGTNYPYWKIRMSAHFQGIDWLVWEICEDTSYVVLEPRARTTQEQKDRHNANSRARVFFCRVFRFPSSRESLIVLPLERSG